MIRSTLYVFACSLCAGALVLNCNIAIAVENEWRVLFDGTSLDAWRGYKQHDDGPPRNWTIQDGALFRSGEGGDVVTREQFEDFELEFEWRISPGGNSGVIYRVTEDEPQTYMTGPEYQVLDNEGWKVAPRDKTAAGALYALFGPQVDATRLAGEWNQGRLVLQGTRVEHWLNGERIVEADLASEQWRERVAGSGFAGMRNFGRNRRGHIALQDHGDAVWYRNIRIRPLSADGPKSRATRPARILFVTQSKGYRHSTVTRQGSELSHTEQIVSELGIRSGLFRVACTQDVANDFTSERLDHYDIVMFYTNGNLPIAPDTLEYFINDWLRQPGRGFIGVHSATSTYRDHEPYYAMLGATFDGHPWRHNAVVTINVHDTTHPVSRPWGTQFTIQDEIYQFKHWHAEKVRVLMSLDMEQTDLKRPYHVPIAWVKRHGEGKVMYMSLGHREEVWTNPTYQESLLGGIKWILGLEIGEAEPNPDISAREEQRARSAASVTR